MHNTLDPRQIASPGGVLRGRLLVKVALALVVAVLSLAAASTASAAAPESDDAVVLPTRVAAAINRTQTALDNAAEHIDEGEYAKAVTSLRAVRNNMYRADRAARAQMNAVPAVPVDPEADPEDVPESTAGPDSVIAVLTLDQTVVTTLAGIFDSNSQGVVVALTHALFQTMTARDKLLAAVIALDPEGAGAAYADGMPDTLDGYTDEVSNLTEALQNDTLSVGGKKVIQAALVKSQATLATITTAFGGGE
jgi:hypothetical protein